MLVGLTGYAGSGKDAAASGLLALGWKRVSFAEPLRQMLYTLNPFISPSSRLKDVIDRGGWQEAKQYPETRRLMQVFGTEVGREMIDPDLWIMLAKKACDDYAKAGYNVVITDCRFPNEAAMIRFNGGKIARIYRDGVTPAQGHVSDTSCDSIIPDYEIINNGSIEDLQNTLKSCIGL